MGAWARPFIDGNVIIKILLLQVAVAALVLFLLKKLLDRELFLCALEKLMQASADQGAAVDEAIIVTANKLSGDEEFRLRTVIKARFPRAEVTIGQDRALWGGILIRAGAQVFDFSLWTKIRQLFKHSDA